MCELCRRYRQQIETLSSKRQKHSRPGQRVGAVCCFIGNHGIASKQRAGLHDCPQQSEISLCLTRSPTTGFSQAVRRQPGRKRIHIDPSKNPGYTENAWESQAILRQEI
jgi:hypothetical protein